MKRTTLLAAFLTASVSSVALAQDKVTIEFAYPYSHLFDVTYEAIVPVFKEAHPDIEVKFRGVLEGHRNHIRHIFFGHCHPPLAGSCLGIPFSSLRGTNHQSWVDFDELELLTSASLPPAYGVVFIQQESVVCHSIDFTDDGEITTATTHYNDWKKIA